ncbi:MAG: protein translocase subunit SecD [Lactobacillales bacterium]|jgi:preprotein translocase subunit SecD|nr:protein translocase subunit SecD [Lactobacillales bacterium]
MFGYSKLKIYAIWVVVILGVFFSIPNFMPRDMYAQLPASMRTWYKPITLGLDLQGGSYLLMEVDTNDLLKEKLNSLADVSRSALRESKIRFTGLAVNENVMQVKILDAAQINDAKDLLRKQDNAPLNIETQDGFLKISYTPDAIENMKAKAVEQSLEIVRRRIDDLGTKEPIIQQQGIDRIVIQLPGVQDPSEIKALLGKTAKMSFHLVDEETSPQMAQMGKISSDSMLMTGDETGYIVLKRAVIVGGDQLDSAKGTYDDKGAPAVSFGFKSLGAKKFGNATKENVGRRLAIVLDGKVISAPKINQPITGGSGIITGNFTVQSANDLALMLRSGALPAPLIVAEERVVGPGLGEDSIKAGTYACLLGLLLIFIFMFAVYGFFGVIANLTLIINGVLLLACLSILNATLTLPGLAGIALTLAMAVDANILIYERMKEEIMGGVTHPAEILKRGFAGSFSAIFDGQLTTLFAALFLFMLGSGPVRGFGVTLGLGLITTMFAAIMVSKVLFIAWMQIKKPTKIDM